ncbi:MAG: hypothetical protein LBG71_00660, partial [Clostridiales Family XIII bacterium]|nr:hypothetical protein [Clostridiales Family XIII bacterium]
MNTEEKRSEARNKMLALLLAVSLLVTCASFASSEGQVNLNTSLPQEDATYEPYDPLDAMSGDAGAVSGGDENAPDGDTAGQENSGNSEAIVIGSGDGTDPADQDGATDPANPDAMINYPSALKPEGTYPGGTGGSGNGNGGSASGGAVTAPSTTNGATEAPIFTPGALGSPDGSILVMPEPDEPIGPGRPPTEGGIYVVPALEPELDLGTSEGAVELETTEGAITSPEAIDVYAVTEIDLSGLHATFVNNGNKPFNGNGYTYNETRTVKGNFAIGGAKTSITVETLAFDNSASGKEYTLKGRVEGLNVSFTGCKDTKVTLDNAKLIPAKKASSALHNPSIKEGSFRILDASDVTLYLKGENEIKGGFMLHGYVDAFNARGEAGIHVEAKRRGGNNVAISTLRIYDADNGNGKLVAEGDLGAAGIGGDYEKNTDDIHCGNVYIYSGTVWCWSGGITGKDGCRGAGIGGGYGGGLLSLVTPTAGGQGGTVKIEGGRVMSQGNRGIGSGNPGVLGKLVNPWDESCTKYDSCEINSGSIIGNGTAYRPRVRRIYSTPPSKGGKHPDGRPLNKDGDPLYLQIIRVKDSSKQFRPDAKVSIEVKKNGTYSYTYEAFTEARDSITVRENVLGGLLFNEHTIPVKGAAYCWLPKGKYPPGSIKVEAGNETGENINEIEVTDKDDTTIETGLEVEIEMTPAKDIPVYFKQYESGKSSSQWKNEVKTAYVCQVQVGDKLYIKQ